MAQELAKTKRRIQSVNSTLKITKAMELVANAKLKKWKNKMENITLYLKEMSNIISSCASGIDISDSEILEFKQFKADSILYIVVTSSLGLCGAYNYNIFKFLNNKIKANDKVLMIGSKGMVKLSQSEINMETDYVSLLDKFDNTSVKSLNEKILSEYCKGIYKEVRLITTTYKNSLTFVPDDVLILPFTPQNGERNDVIFEPNEKEVLSLLIPKYLHVLLYGRLTEAIVCEYASRRNAMDTATDNAEELSEKLLLEFNKARQQAITQEISEVAGGANNK